MELIKQNYIYITKTPKSEIEKIDFASCAEPTQTLENYYNKQSVKPDILINGGFFSFSTGKPVMDFIDEGQVKAAEAWMQYGLGIDKTGNLIYGKDSDRQWRDFISSFPTLVADGKKVPIEMAYEISGKARRTILGYDQNYIYTISIDSPGATLTQSANIALDTGCQYAINLDGGGSTRLLYQGKTYAAGTYNRPVDNIVAIYLKKQQESFIYRVQLGAFSSKENATAFCEKIKLLGGNYQNAFVRYIAPYYKVQVGAFSIKQNAENMLNDLKSKGYSAFIVAEKR